MMVHDRHDVPGFMPSLRCLIIAAGMVLISGMMSPGFAVHSYFIDTEIQSDTIQLFTKWTDMLARYDATSHTLDKTCGGAQYSTCKLTEWHEYVESLRGKPLLEQMEKINLFVNKYPYVEDIVNWGVDDYWADVYEFQHKSGDCEDYAIAKFTALRALGVPNDMMRIAVVEDLNLGGIIHAILLVTHDNKMYVLDNQIKQVILASDIYHYKPIYSINETHWWRHIATEQ